MANLDLLPVEDIAGRAGPAAGVDLVLVINANDTIDERDGTSSSRADKVREAINLYADQFMDEADYYVERMDDAARIISILGR